MISSLLCSMTDLLGNSIDANCNTKKKEAFILLVDFQKAFDSINHEYIDNVLKIYGFGESICRWVRLFFDKREAVISGLKQSLILVSLPLIESSDPQPP